MRSPHLVAAIVLCGCAAEIPADPELANASAKDDESVGPDASFAPSYSFYAIRAEPDSTWSLQRLNYTQMKCHDGVYRDRCASAQLDWSVAHLGDANQATLLRAAEAAAAASTVLAIVRGCWHDGMFQPSEAWVAEPNSQPDGVFVRVRDNGIRCIVAPCPHFDEAQLNSTSATRIDELDYSASPFAQHSIEALAAACESPDGILVAGRRFEVFDYGHGGLGRTVTAAYRRLVR